MTELINLRLTAIRYAAKDTNLYEFSRPEGGRLPAAEPGAHVDLHLPNGAIRQYSLTEAGTDLDRYVVAVKRDPASRGGSAFMHEQLRVGAIIPVSAPRNNFPLDEKAPHTVLIAGGIGITPIWCMSERLRMLDHPWSMFYSCRSREEAAFLPELRDRPNVTFNFDAENGGRFLDLAAIIAGAPDGSHFYCCGPTPMLQAFEAASAGLPPERVHVEYFTASKPVATGGGYVIELARSGQEFIVQEGQTILDVLVENGIFVSYSCQEGICGACETKVLSGTPDHRDAILSDAERAAGKTMMVCCSGSLSDRLVLDL